ncbi:MAG: MFS transporter [Woeseiaceae bacterium]|nr:MFS transporter [Woeseiaceae bacterium]
MTAKNLLDSKRGRFLTFGLMYISEGIPYGFTSAAMVAFMRVEGVSLDLIGVFVAALFLPWGFKWAWAPLVDIFRFNRFGGRKAWIVFCTSMIVITLSTTAILDLVDDFEFLVALIVLNNFFCATQDVAIDSLAVSVLREDERGRGNGFMFGGQYAGIAMGGAGAIFVSGLFGFDAALLYICGLMILNLLFIVFFVRDPDVDKVYGSTSLTETLKTFGRELKIGFMDSGSGPKLGLLFAIAPIGTMALAYATLSTIQVDYGLTENQIATFSASNTIAAAIGCIVGGLIADRFGLKRVVFLGYAATAIPTLVLASYISAMGLQQVPYAVLYACIVGHGLLFGGAFGVRAAVFMGMTNPAVGATMFTGFMAISNITISYTNYWQGLVAESYGYATVLFAEGALMLISLAIIPFLRNREAAPKPAVVPAT